jgi:hypothetical protein
MTLRRRSETHEIGRIETYSIPRARHILGDQVRDTGQHGRLQGGSDNRIGSFNHDDGIYLEAGLCFCDAWMQIYAIEILFSQ